MAPEIFQKRSCSYKIDVFAYGTLIWELYSREVPYEGQDPQDIMKKVLKGEPLKKVDFSIQHIVTSCR
jgi:serine/threonine protein kinase